MARIKDMTMTIMDIMIALGEGNPGAFTVMAKIIEEAEKVDPQAMLGGAGKLLSLDTFGIYGPDIWKFYKDICRQDIVKMIGVMRAVQLGFLSEATLKSAIEGRYELPVDELLTKVRERLPQFQRAA